nr:Gag-Pol polyprotein [Tanacetum cinerariifolium]
LKNVSYHKLYDILKQHQHEVNEIRAEKIARVANPLALVAQQQPVYHPQTHPTNYNQNSSTRLQQATRNRGKAIINSPRPIYDQEPSMVDDDDETSKDKEIDKLMALISLSFKKIYKPTNNNLRTSSNTSRANQDNSLRIHRNAGYKHQSLGNVVGARETKPKREKDAAYHREKMLLCEQEEAGIQLNTEQADWKDDTDDESDDQELEAHYMYIAKLQQVFPDDVDSGPIFDTEPEQKVQNDDQYDVFAIECQHPKQSESVRKTYLIEQDAHNVIIELKDMNYDSKQIDQNDEDADLAKEQQTDGEALINSIKNGDQPLPRFTQVSIAGTTSTEQSFLKDKSMCNKTAKDLWDALARHMLGFEYGKQDRKAAVLYEYETFKATEGEKQYATMMRQNKNAMNINIDALYNILKQNQGDVNDAMGSKKKTVVVTSDPLALIAEKTNVSRSKEKVVVSSDSEGSEADDFKLLIDNSILSHESFDSNFEDNPLISRPLPEQPDDNFDLEPEVISAVMEDIDEPNELFNPGGEIFVSTNIKDIDYFPFMFVIRIFLPYLIFPKISPLLLFAESEDTIFDPGISE